VSSCLSQEMLTQNYETYYICIDMDIHLDRLIFMFVRIYTLRVLTGVCVLFPLAGDAHPELAYTLYMEIYMDIDLFIYSCIRCVWPVSNGRVRPLASCRRCSPRTTIHPIYVYIHMDTVIVID